MANYKTFAQLAAQSDVQDADLLAAFRGTGPLKSVSAAVLYSYLSGKFGSAAQVSTSSLLQTANNLSDLASVATARTNLGAAAAASPTITGGMTLSGGMSLSGAVAGNVVAPAATTLDVSQGEFQTKTISANTAFALAGATAGKWSAMLLELTTSASAQPTFTGARWSNGTKPTFPNGTHQIGLNYNGSAWTANVVAMNVS